MPALYGSALGVLVLVLGLPLIAGLAQTLGSGTAHLGTAWHSASISLGVRTALVATLVSLISALGLAACLHGRVRLLTWLSLPLLAIPHGAVAQALALLLSSSGFVV